ncbi:MAG: hypothetical protein FWG40_05635 [Peptococcaceae bacterium]|nr:hypothetical protein [Peptococcaceae bacterium]
MALIFSLVKPLTPSVSPGATPDREFASPENGSATAVLEPDLVPPCALVFSGAIPIPAAIPGEPVGGYPDSGATAAAPGEIQIPDAVPDANPDANPVVQADAQAFAQVDAQTDVQTDAQADAQQDSDGNSVAADVSEYPSPGALSVARSNPEPDSGIIVNAQTSAAHLDSVAIAGAPSDADPVPGAIPDGISLAHSNSCATPDVPLAAVPLDAAPGFLDATSSRYPVAHTNGLSSVPYSS